LPSVESAATGAVKPRCAGVAATPFALKMQAKPPSEMMVASAEGTRASRRREEEEAREGARVTVILREKRSRYPLNVLQDSASSGTELLSRNSRGGLREEGRSLLLSNHEKNFLRFHATALN
jgi:hypothetical protein